MPFCHRVTHYCQLPLISNIFTNIYLSKCKVDTSLKQTSPSRRSLKPACPQYRHMKIPLVIQLTSLQMGNSLLKVDRQSWSKVYKSPGVVVPKMDIEPYPPMEQTTIQQIASTITVVDFKAFSQHGGIYQCMQRIALSTLCIARTCIMLSSTPRQLTCINIPQKEMILQIEDLKFFS